MNPLVIVGVQLCARDRLAGWLAGWLVGEMDRIGSWGVCEKGRFEVYVFKVCKRDVGQT